MAENLPPIVHENLRTPGRRRAPQRHMASLAAVAGSYPSPNYSTRRGTKVTGIVIHTTEGIADATALGAFFAVPARQASSHVGIDDVKTVAYVDPVFEAWTLRNGNPWTENAEMCGFAHWTRAEWLAHPGIVKQAAEWVAARCKANGIPPVRITADDIRAGRRTGYFAHWDYTLATGDGTHWDVGLGFPWDVFAGLVQAAYNPAPTPAPVSVMEDDDMLLIRNASGAVHLVIGDRAVGVPNVKDYAALQGAGVKVANLSDGFITDILRAVAPAAPPTPPAPAA